MIASSERECGGGWGLRMGVRKDIKTKLTKNWEGRVKNKVKGRTHDTRTQMRT